MKCKVSDITIQNPKESSSDELHWTEKHPTSSGLNRSPPGRLYRYFSKQKLEKTVAGGKSKKFLARQFKVCAAHKKQSETRYICKLWIGPLHKGSCFKKYHSIRNCYTLNKQFLQ